MEEAYQKVEQFHRQLRALQISVGDGPLPLMDMWHAQYLKERINLLLDAGVVAHYAIGGEDLSDDSLQPYTALPYIDRPIGETLKNAVLNSGDVLWNLDPPTEDAVMKLFVAIHSTSLACQDLGMAVGFPIESLAERNARMQADGLEL